MTIGSQIKQTAASLKGVKATLDIYASQSATQEEKEVFERNSIKLQNVIQTLEDRIAAIELEEPQYKGF